MNGLPSEPTPNNPADAPGRGRRVEPRHLALLLALVSLLLSWIWMAEISRTDPWYRNTNTNIHNLVDALAINSGLAPVGGDPWGFPSKYLLALDYRVRHFTGFLPVWNFKKFRDSPDPLPEIRNLVRIGRIHHRILVLLCILSAAGLTYAVTRQLAPACFTVILLGGSAGLLFHGLLTQPELLCVGFGGVLALLGLWQATVTPSWWRNQVWLFLAGALGGLAALTHLSGVCYLVFCFAWCWLDALTAPTSRRPGRPGFGHVLLPVAAACATFWLLIKFAPLRDVLGPPAVLRLRLAAGLVGVLPLLALFPGRRLWLFLLDRCRELALLGGGALASLGLGYLLLRSVLPEPAASGYLARILDTLFDPGAYLKIVVPAEAHLGRESFLFLKETPFLYLGTIGAAVALCFMRPVSSRLRAFIVFLLIQGLGLTLLLSRQFFADQYSIFPQVPLLLACSLSLYALGIWRPEPAQKTGVHWAFPISITAALVLMLTVYFRLQPKYTSLPGDAGLPVNDLTLTFLFDHDAHPRPYLQIMGQRYGSREKFADALKRYLDNPANRY